MVAVEAIYKLMRARLGLGLLFLFPLAFIVIGATLISTLVASANNPPPGANSVLTVTKTVQGSAPGQVFEITVTGATGVVSTTTIVAGQTITFAVPSGLYTVTETSPGAGWATTYNVTTGNGYVTPASAVVTLTNAPNAPAVASGTLITGTVYRDVNSDGRITANGVITETGVQSVTVTAYDRNGNVAGATTTAASGRYTLTTTAAGPWRVEFSDLPVGYEPSRSGLQNGTSVQFVSSTSAARNVNFGIARPTDFCQANPLLAMPAHLAGTGVGQTSLTNDFAMTYFPYNNPTNLQRTNVATLEQVGSLWGVAYQRESARVFSSAFLKRHVGVGPRGLDGVYVFDRNSPSLLGGFDLENVSPVNGGIINLGTVTRTNVPGVIANSSAGDYQLSADPGQASIDLDGFAKVGKVGYGDIDMAPDDQTLWMVNLNQRTLVKVDLDQVTVSNTNPNPAPAAAVSHYAIVTGTSGAPLITGAPTCSAGTLRPFGLKILDDIGYLGVVCDAATSGTRLQPSQLIAYVLSFDPANPTSFTTEVTIPMNYTREVAYQGNNNANETLSGVWQRWASSWDDFNNYGGTVTPNFRSAPQPILSDIEFADDGAMILGIADRGAHMGGSANYPAIPYSGGSRPGLINMITAGDTLRVPRVGDGWGSPEDGENDPGEPAWSGTAANRFLTNDSAGNHGEFFFGDIRFDEGANEADGHYEVTEGALAVLPGRNEMVSTVMDPILFFQQGTRWFNTTTGDRTRNYASFSTSFSDPARFGKGAGVGDLELLCDPAPIEIGNRVWNDTNANGIQDPGEPGLTGVAVTLTLPTGGSIATVTGIDGTYYFTREATTGAYSQTLRPNATYTISVGLTQAALNGFDLTAANADGLTTNDAIADVRDSDATAVNGLARIVYTTGGPGRNNHGLDFGFEQGSTGHVEIVNTPPPPDITHFKDFVAAIAQGDGTWDLVYRITVQNIGGSAGQYDLEDEPTFDDDLTLNSASFVSSVPSGNALAGSGPWTLADDVSLNAGASHIYTLTVNATLNLTAGSGGDNVYTACEAAMPGNPEAGEGGFNESRLDTNNDGTPDEIDEACGDVPHIVHDKEFVSATAAAGDAWDVVYRITVNNNGGASGVYTLSDQPAFDDDIDINSASFASTVPSGGPLAGDGPWALATNQSLNAGASHIYTLTVNVDMNLAGGIGDDNYDRCLPTPDGVPDQGLFNRVTLTQPGQPGRDADACGDLPHIVHDKEFVSATAAAGDTWDVVYRITVNNNGGASGTYSLSDQPAFDDDIDINSASFASTVPSGGPLAGDGPWSLATNQSLNAGASHVYTLTVNVDMDLAGGSGDDSYDRCLPTPDGAPDQGLFNRATLTQPGQPGRDADACGDLPHIVHDKEFVSATAAAGDTWDVVYRITVNNNGGTSGVYSLSDQPAMDDDIDINSASFASTVPSGGPLAGDGPWTLATNQSLNAGASHVYTLTVNVGLDLAGGSGDDVYDRCLPTPDGAPDQGLFNRATLTQPGQPGRDADACGDLPNIVHDKEFVSATAAAGDTWDVVYRITVNNNGGASGTYSLSDQPSFDDDIDINSAGFASTVPSGGPLAGDGPWSLATNQSLNAGASHVYTLTVNVDMNLAGGIGDDSYDRCQPTPDGAPDQGLFNRVTLTQPGQPGRDADACGDIPSITHDKTFVSVTEQPDGTWNLVYRIDVLNNGGATGEYDLEDEPTFDDDLTLNSAGFVSTVPSGGPLAGDGPWTLADDVSLAAGASHVYTLTVNATLNLSAGSGGDNTYTACETATPGNPEAGEGGFNESRLDTNNDGTPDEIDEACGDVPYLDLALRKTLAAGQAATVQAGDDVAYSIEVFNQGRRAATDVRVTDYIPAGMTLSPNAVGWTAVGNTAVITVPTLAVGQSTTLEIVLRVDGGFQGSALTNWAEISEDNGNDVDSVADNGNQNTVGEQPPQLEDNQIDENGLDGGDEDDHDPATVNVGQVYDLALRKTLAAGQAAAVQPGADVTYTIQVLNQGSLDAANVQVVDYIPAGMTLSPLASGWTDNGSTATRTVASLPAGQSVNLTIVLRIDPGFQGTALVNGVEITADNGDDIDSTPDNQDGNTPGEDANFKNDEVNEDGFAGGDEDDHDREPVTIVRPGITHDKTFVSVTAAAGNTWNLVYRITVVNNGGVTGEYDLEDEPTFDDDLTLNSAGFVSTAPSGGPLAGDGPWTLADDVSLAAGASHVYTLTVNATLNLSAGSGGDNVYTACETATPGNPEAGEGGFNESRLDTDNDGTPDEIDEACGDVPNITHEKTFVSVTEQPDGTWNLVYRIDVLNNGGATGQYDLEDEPTFDDDLTLNSAGFVSTVPSGGPLAGNGPWTLADDVSLAAGASHVYTLTVNATLNLSAGSGGDNVYTACETATPGNPEAGEGGFNESRLDTDNDGTPDEIDEACGDVPYLDLALRKTLAAGQAATVQAGDDVAYSIEVFNQGRRAATDVRVTDYIPAGMTLSPNAVGWTAVGNTAEITVPTLGVGQSTTLEIVLRVDGGFQGAQLTNWAEISEDNGNDVDSVADNGNQNTVGEQPPQLEDNQIDENGLDGGDEDDHDPATVNVGQVYDLALRKTLAAGQAAAVQPGADVTYTIQVLNQGSLDAANVQVVDYIPAGMTLSPLASGWTDNGSTATRTVASLPAGQSVNLTIVLRVAPGFQGTALVNGAEITADNGDDIDSTPDNQDGNTPGEDVNFKNDEVNEDGFAGGDEDDHDREPVTIVRPGLNHDKEFVSATAANGGWNVVYRITVNNTGTASGVYTLTDQPAMDNDVTINSASFVSSVPSNGALAGSGPWSLATNQSLAAGASHIYTLTVNVGLNLAGGGGNDVYDRCLPTPDGAPNQGLFNRATLTQPGQPGRDADACGDLPNIVHDKEFVSATAANGGWNVVYRIVATNNGGASGVYTLTDQPAMDDDVTINSASFVSSVPSNGALAGSGPWTLATNQSLAAGASHVYTLTVNVGLNLAGGGGNDVYDRCLPTPDGAPNQGLFNRATLTQPGQPGRDADACGDVPNIVHDKEFVSATAANGGWNVVYRIVATNNGGASGVYTLTDQPAMDDDVTINSASFVSSVPSNGALNGSGPWTLATNQSLNAGASHVYTLTVNVGLNLAGGAGDDEYDRCLPTPDGAPNQGLFNRATLTQPGQPGRDADACGDIPNITHDKQFVSLTQVTGNTWSVVYRIIVTNGGGMPGQYDLSDQPAFDDDVAITGASFVSTVPSNGNLAATPWVLANDVNLAAGASHIYTLTVGVRLDLSTGSSGDNIVTRCGTETPGDPQAGEGLFNESRLDLNNDGVPDEIDDVCENLDYMDLALRKRPAATNPPTLRPGDLVTFTVEVFNQGVLTATNIQVVDYIPAGAALSATTPGWTAQNGTATATIASLAPSQTATLTLALRIGVSFQATSLTNYAEIAGQTGGQDIDSTPDSQNQNTPGEQPPALEDDQVNENGQNGADEDDHDLATVAISQLADWGDLPARYPTTAANVGANHRIEPGVFLGARVDGEGDGQPSVGANGDDNNPVAGPDDEDGVVFLTPLMPGTTAQIRVTASVAGFLNGWFDWNNNGLLESGERVFADAALNAGANTLNVNVPANANPEELYARFRLTTGRNQAIAPTGSAPNGEVEDYVLLSLGDTVFLDNGQGSGVPNDGKQTGDEPGVANVTVQLLSSQGAVIATTTTDAQGNYLFTGLPAGDYRVRVAAAEFQPGGDLAGRRSSTGAGNPNADLDQDVDENGVDDANPAANGISSGVITLSPAGEPDAAVDGNGVNSNLTLDFGFVRYDLALRKSVSGYSETPLVPGVSKITFRIEVINQGDVAASNVTVVDYLQNGYTFDAADNPGWTGGANPTTVIAGPIQPGDIVTVNLVLRLSAGTRGATLANFAEIANDGWPTGSDPDSTPDTQNQETPVKDDVIDEDGKNVPGEDEDDHDVAIVTVQVFDLALMKRVAFAPSPLVPGQSKVTFAIEVFNQGDITATNVLLTDYVQQGFTFSLADNPGWTAADPLKPTLLITGAIAPGRSAVVNVVLGTTADGARQVVNNFAEISDVDDTIVGNAPPIDVDSTPDNLNQESPVKDDVITEDGKNVPGQDEDDHDIASLRLPGVGIGGFVWADLDNSGTFQQGETTFDGVTVQLYRAGDTPGVSTPVASQVTTNGGNYLFTDLAPGRYFVYIPTPPAGHPLSSTPTDTADNQQKNDDNGIQPTVGGGTSSPVIDLQPGQEPLPEIDGTDTNIDSTIDFGFLPPVSLGNLVWHDANDNGQRDNGEAGIDGVGVQLYRADQTPGVDAPVATTTTAGGGQYLFSNLTPGEYIVYIPAPPAAYPASSSVTDTADNGQDNDDNGAQATVGGPVTSPTITLTPGQEPTSEDGNANSDLTIDFGFYGPLSLGDIVWHDANNNGLRDNGETGIAGVNVQLFQAGQTPGVDNPVAVDVTDANGNYRFDGLRPGQYFVYMPTPPADYPTSSTPTSTADDNVNDDDNGVQASTGAPVTSAVVTLTSGAEPNENGQANLTIDFGFYRFDLALRKTVASLSSTPLAPGVSTITFTLTVFNQGDIPASNVTVVDYVPAGLVFEPALNPGWSGSPNPTTVIAGPIQPGQSTTVQIVLRVAAGAAGQSIANAAEIANDNQPPGTDPDSRPDTQNQETPVKDDVIDEDAVANPGVDDEDDHDIAVVTVDTFDLALRKRVVSQSDSPLAPGVSTVTFSIEVFNQGDVAASNVTVIDYVPAGLVFDPSINPGWSGSPNPTTVIAGPIQPGQSATVQIVLRVAVGTAGLTINNAAEIADDSTDGADVDSTPDTQNQETPVKDDVIDENALANPGVDDEDDHDIAPITVGAFDLALRKQLIPGQHPTFQANDSVRFLIEVFNQGNITATNITIVDYIPAGFVLSSTAPVNAGWVVNGNVAQTTLPGPLAPGASITREIVLFVVEAAGVVTNYAEITGASDEDGTPTPDIDSTPDAINGNDPYVDDVIDDDGTIDEDDHDGAPITVDRFDMSLIKRLADGQEVQVQTGDDVEYTIQIRNEGSALASEVLLIDYIPTGFILSPVDPYGWVASADGRTATNSIPGPIPPGGTASINILLRVTALEPATYINWAEILFVYDEEGNPHVDEDSTPNDDPGDDDIDGDGIPDEDDIDAAVVEIQKPTAITLSSFTANFAGGVIQVLWTTTLELDTVGFHLYRSTSGGLNDAVRITPALIPGQGSDGGAYSFTDTRITAGVTYWYWLVETETTGTINYYGPVRATAIQGYDPEGRMGIFLPIISR